MSGQLKLSKVFYINPTSIMVRNHTPPPHFQGAHIPPYIRNRDNAWKNRVEEGGVSWSKTGNLPQLPPKASDAERYDRWDTLKQNIKTNGFDEKHPILVHLDSDYIIDGNHRLAISLELKLDYVPVRFQYIFLE